MSRPRTLAPLVVACTLIPLLAGCTPGDPAATAATAATTSPPVLELTDAEACEQLSAPMSMIFNAQVAPEGAMSAETAGGLYSTASWELRRIDAALDDSELDAPVTRLGEAATTMSARVEASSDPASWADQLEKIETANQEITAACNAAGTELVVLGWYGG
ncbi:hypothetical protein [Agromyces sp. NPDC058104]|uniref:hypothetical protein n=1 Tax=Agromyces sp. NPDC058104 TaxID=3346342 RepID=UPI0036DE91C9